MGHFYPVIPVRFPFPIWWFGCGLCRLHTGCCHIHVKIRLTSTQRVQTATTRFTSMEVNVNLVRFRMAYQKLMGPRLIVQRL